LALGRRAKEMVQSQIGATSRTVEALKTLLVAGSGRTSPPSAQAAHND
jgi:hypothetical protein